MTPWLAKPLSYLAGAGATIARATADGMAGVKRRGRAGGEAIFAALNAYGAHPGGQPGTWGIDRAAQARHFRLWTYVAIKAIAEQIARHPPRVAHRLNPEQAEAKGGRKNKRLVTAKVRQKALTGTLQAHEELEAVDSDHPLYRLLQNPNRPDVSYTFWYRLIMALELTGEAYIVKLRNKAGLPSELWPIPSHWVWPVPGENRLVDAYEIRPAGQGRAATLRFEPEDVVPIVYPSPVSIVRGWSPLGACAEWVDCAEAIDSDRWYSFKNGMWPGMVIELEAGSFGRVPDRAEVERLYAMLDARLRGKENSSRPVMLNPGMKAVQFSRTPVEMAYEQSAGQVRDQVLASHHVSKSVAGINEETNRATQVASLANFIENTCGPKFTLIGQIMTEHIAREYEDDLVVYWPNDLPQDPDAKRADLEFQRDSGALTPNEIRTEFGREPFEFGGDDPLLPPALAPVPWATGQQAEGDELAQLLAAEHQGRLTDATEPPDDGGGDGEPKKTAEKAHGANGRLNGLLK